MSASALRAQIIIDRRPEIPIFRAYEVREVTVNARLLDQTAEVQVSQTFHNPGGRDLEVEFFFPLPEEGAIQNFVLMVDGKEIPGRLLSKDEARRIYENIVRTRRDPALLEYVGRGLLRTSVFPVPAGADRTVTLRYTQFCRRDRDIVEFSYPLAAEKFTDRPIQRLAVTVRLQTREPIKSIYSPFQDVRIERSGDKEATVRFEQANATERRDFRLFYTLAKSAVSISMLSYRPADAEDGYFLLLASPEFKPPKVKPIPKTVIFVLDRSGSMSGKKIEQAKRALRFVLENLKEGDTFNIVAYDDSIETFKPEIQHYDGGIREEATRFVSSLQPGGGTNINEALKTAMGMLRDDSRPSYLIFLTDGLPTVGEQRETVIAESIHQANKVHARLFAFGVGYDVNARLIDRLSGGNGGGSEFVKPEEDIETGVARLFGKLTSPALTQIKLDLAHADAGRVYPADIPDLFEGGQLVVVGRYRQSGPAAARLTGKVASESRTYETSATLAGAGGEMRNEFIARLWATRRIGSLIDQIDLNGPNKELQDELVALSTRYGILTPYTAYLADDRAQLAGGTVFSSVTSARRGASPMMGGMMGRAPSAAPAEALSQTAGESAIKQREFKADAMKADRVSYLALPAMSGAPGQNQQPAGTIRQVGAKTFYLRDGCWADSAVKPEESAKAIVIKQFSDEFFKLLSSVRPEENQYFTFKEPVTIKLGGKIYRIEPEVH